MLAADHALAVNDEGLGHTVAAPVDGDAPVTVGAHGSEGLSQRAQEAAGIVGLVLVVDADQPDVAALRQFHQHRVFLAAGHAP